MNPPRFLQFRRDESGTSRSSDTTRISADQANIAGRTSSTALDRYAVLRLRQTAISQPGDLVDYLSERGRASSATMSGQF